MLRRVQLTAAVVAIAAAVAAAEPTPTRPPEVTLAADGRFAEAYAALAGRGAERQPEDLQALARALLVRGMDSPDAFERWAALRAARTAPDPALVAPALRQLTGDGRYEQALALEILAASAPEASRGAFVTSLDSPHRTVRLRAVRALRAAEANRDELIPRFAALATDDPDPDVRVAAVRTLRDWRAVAAMAEIRRAVSDRSPGVCREAVVTLVGFGDPLLSSVIRERLATAPAEQRAQVLRLAGLVPAHSLLPAVGPFLSDGDPEVRAAAAAAVLGIAAGEVALP